MTVGMGMLDGRVAIVTGAGRGLGREHALLLAAEGASVVVNDRGGDLRGEGSDKTPAQSVVDEILASGGNAVANTDDVTDWAAAERMVEQAVTTYGTLHVLVNNAGILRDRVIANMSGEEWDAVLAVHLRGHFCATRHAAAYWRAQAKAGAPVPASIVHTTSTAGLFANVGQANYGAAKSGIATLSQIAAKELSRYGVRSNAIAPAARTRITADVPRLGESVRAPDDPDAFDEWHPGNVSPFVGYLATESCTFTGETFLVFGGLVQRVRSWSPEECIHKDGRWTIAELSQEAPRLEAPPGSAPADPFAWT